MRINHKICFGGISEIEKLTLMIAKLPNCANILETKNNVLLSKIDAVYEKISQLQTESVSDEDIKKFLIISSLKDQILRSEK